MPARTCYVALPFERCPMGTLTPRAVRDCRDESEARRAAETFAETYAGALAFSRVIDIDTGRALAPRILAKVGDVPDVRYLLG